VREREMDVGIDQCHALELLNNVRQLRLVALEELATCRHIVEEILNQEVGPNGTVIDLLRHDPSALDAQTGTQVALGTAGAKGDLCHSGNAGKRLATEPHRGEAEEVGGLRNLAGGMTLKSQTGIGLGHAFTVVDDLNPHLLQSGWRRNREVDE